MKSIIEKAFRAIFSHDNPIKVKREYGIPDNLSFSIRLTPEGWFAVSVPELPGLVTQADSKESLMEMVNDAVLTYYDVPKRKADMIYNRMNVGDEVVEYKGELQTQTA